MRFQSFNPSPAPAGSVFTPSDRHTLGYDFKPWTDAKAIADGPAILRYTRETADEAGITPHIRFGHAVRSAEWWSQEACWTVEAERTEAGQRVTLCARFFCMCCSYAQGHRPSSPAKPTTAAPSWSRSSGSGT